MQRHYPQQDQEDLRFTRKAVPGVLLRVLEGAQLILILAYCSLSRSFESAVALLFLLACVALTLNKRYIYDKKREVLLGHFAGESLRPLQTRRVLWAVFLTLQVLFTIFKTVYFTTDVIHLDRSMQESLEVQSLVYAFVPCVFLGTTPALILIKHRKKPLEEFKQPISRLVVVVLHALLIMLLVVLQFLNVSVVSLLLVLIVAGLNAGKPWSFSRKRWLVLATMFIIAGWIVAIFVCSISCIELGVIAGNITGLELQLPLNGYSIAFVVCMPVTYLIAAFMNRLYSYEQVRRRFSEDREHFLMHRHDNSEELESKENDEQEDSYEQQPMNLITELRPMVNGHVNGYEKKPESEGEREGSNKVSPNGIKQMQLTNRYEMSKSFSAEAQPLDSERRSLAFDNRRCASSNTNKHLEQPPVPHTKSMIEVPNQAGNSQKAEQDQPKKQHWSESVMDLLKKISGVLTSVHFNFRLLQLITIVLIQRYNTFYSLLLMLWLLLSSVFTKIHFLRTSTIVLVLPAALFNYFPLYYANVNQAPLPTSCGVFPCSVYGFLKWPSNGIWVDVIIFNYYIYLLLTFLKITTGEILAQLKRKLRDQRRKKLGLRKKTRQASYWKIFLGFVFKYTYLVTLIIMFMVGFNSVNLIHLGFALLFLVFFALGQQLIVRTIVRGCQPRKIISTFSQKYWVIIVNFTGVAILLKYVYFLLFSSYNPSWLLLTGVSKVYDTTVNFSLTSYCQSSTTYFFLVYILAALQLEVCRSDIYKEISVDLSFYISQKAFFRQRWSTISKVWEIMNILYYQCLFLVSAVVVLVLNWRWSVNGVIIAFAVSYGVVYGFGKGRLWVVAMWSNLSFIIINYLLMFLSFDYVNSSIGPIFKQIEYYAHLLGFFEVEESSLQLTFLNNIIIFLFTVQSQQLYRVLISRNLYPDEPLSTNIPEENRSHRLRESTDRSSSKMSSVQLNHDLTKNNERFAEIYLKNVILVTCAYYEKDLAEYKFVHSLQTFLAFIATDLALVFVIVCSLYFRLAVTMFIFLTIYLMHFLLQFKEISGILKSTGYLSLLEKHLKKFEQKVEILYSDAPEPVYKQGEDFEQFAQLIRTNKLCIMGLKQAFRKRMWPYAAFFSFGCLLLTYSLQIVSQDFCANSCTYTAYIIQKTLFVLGLSTTNDKSLWREAYFYFFMVFVSMFERYLLNFTEKEYLTEKASSKSSSGIKKGPSATLLNIREEEDDEEDTASRLRRPTSEQHQLFQTTVHNIGSRHLRPPVLQPPETTPPTEQVYQQANLVLFYTFSKQYIKIKSVYGILSVLLRVYISLLLINCSEKSNIFSWVYLLIAGVFWVKSIRFEMVESINRISIIILLVQYFMLLLNINPNSPFYDAQYGPYSLVGMVLKDPSWLSYLAFGGVPTNDLRGSSQNVSFIINSIIIFATEYYFSLFYLSNLYTLSTFKKLKVRYEYIVQELVRVKTLGKKLYISYEDYKSTSYRMMRKLYETITIHYHIILSLLILLIVLSFTTAISIGLMIVASAYFCLVIFAGGSKQAEDMRVQKYTYIYFYLCKITSFLELLLLTIFHIPTLLNQCVPSNTVLNKVCSQIKIMSITSDLFLLLFVQLWFDMYESEEYKRFVAVYKRSTNFIHELMTKCYVYRLNDQRLKDMFKEHQDILNFQQQVNLAMESIEQWHRIMRKEADIHELKGDLDKLRQLRHTIKLSVNQTEIEMQAHPNPSITQKVFHLCKRFINHTLYQSVPTLVSELKGYNCRVLSNVKVSCHDFVTENFEQLGVRMKELQTYYDGFYKKISDCDSKACQELLQKQVEQLPPAEPNLEVMLMPSLIEIKEQRPNLTLAQIALYLFASRFDDLVLFFILMYYMVNPCFASLPIVIMVLSYEIQADVKRKNWLLIYIVLLIAAIQVVQEYIELNANKAVPSAYTWFFFVGDSRTPYSTAYLQFLLVLVLVNELLKMWIGMDHKEPVQIQNPYQALVRCQINSSTETDSKQRVEEQPDSEGSIDLEVSIHHTKREIEKSVISGTSTNQKALDEKDRNPYQVCIEQLEGNCKLILDEDASSGFFRKLKLMRDGVDLYPFIATIQIITVVYLIIFYPIMQNTDQSQGPTTLESNKFSAALIISVLVFVAVAVIERFIATLPYHRGRKEYIKYIYTMILLFLVCLEAYYLAPYDSSSVEVSYSPPPALIGFMFLQFLYFIFSALQIKWGYKKYKRLNSMLHKRTYPNYLITMVFTAIPFLYELKLIMDWSFSTTGLTLDNWIRHFNIYLTSFTSLINGKTNEGYKLGAPIPRVSKVLFGWCGFILILLLIFGPMILFSSLNPISESNLVIGGTLSIGIQIRNSNYFELYSTSHFSQSPTPINSSTFKQLDFQQIPMLQSLTPTDLEQQFEQINYFPYGDNLWGISTPNYNLLVDTINATLNGQQPNNEFIMTIQYQLNRNISTTVSTPTTYTYPFLNNTSISTNSTLSLTREQLISINQTLTQCNSPTALDNFYISLIRLETQGNSFKPHPIIKNNSNGIPLYIQNITMSLICNRNTTGETSSATSLYWEVTLNNGQSGLVMYVLCDKYTSLSFGFTFIGLYTSIILVIANFLRGFFTGDISLIPYSQNPRPESILCICQAIEVVRMRENMREEVLLYYQLVDIMRSPEIMKYMCGGYSKFIKDNDEKKAEMEKAAHHKTD